MSERIEKGHVVITTNFYLDGENCGGGRKYNVKCINFWGGKKGVQPKEIVTECGTHYRQTSKNGWREYRKRFDGSWYYVNNSYTGKIIQFIPNKTI